MMTRTLKDITRESKTQHRPAPLYLTDEAAHTHEHTVFKVTSSPL